MRGPSSESYLSNVPRDDFIVDQLMPRDEVCLLGVRKSPPTGLVTILPFAAQRFVDRPASKRHPAALVTNPLLCS